MTPEEHIERHKKLCKYLDELLADFIWHTKKSLNNTTIMEFLDWSHSQTIKPDEKE